MFLKWRLCFYMIRMVIIIISVWTWSIDLSLAQTVPAPNHILIFNSYDFGLPAYRGILLRSLETYLRTEGFNKENLHVELMEFVRNSGPDDVEQLNVLFQKRYANYQIKMIIRDFLTKIPMTVMLGSQNLEGQKVERPVELFVGRVDIVGTLNSAIALLPDTRQVLVIHGPNEADRSYEIQARKEFEAWAGKLEIEYLSALPMEEMLRKVADLPPRTIIMYLNFSRDVTGRPFMPRAVLESISQAANAPVFGLYDILIDRGVVGGSMLSFQDEGARVGAIALDILNGKVPAVAPQNLVGTTKFVFDWKQLNRWGLSETRLPADRIVMNRPDSIWSRYKAFILATLAFILLLCLAIIFLFLNILKRKRAEEALRKSETNYRLLFESASDGITVVDGQGRYVDANAAACRMFGYDAEELIGKPMSVVKAPCEKSPEEAAQDILDQLHGKDAWRGEVYCRKKDQSTFWCYVNISTFNHTTYGKVWISVYSDITERKSMIAELEKSYQQLRMFNQRWVEIEEIERKRLSAELHDEIGQNLTALGINFSILKMSLPSATDALIYDRINESMNLLNRTTTQIKGMMSNLRPTILDEYGLVPALEWYSQENAKRTGIEIAFAADDIPFRPKAEIETALFRIAQEAINNSLKHAKADHISVTLNYEKKKLYLAMVNHGSGFEIQRVQEGDNRGWGLMIMKERCAAINGLFQVESNPGEGTSISVEVPI